MNKHNKNKKIYQDYQQKLNESGEVQISTSDPESRQMITRNNITEVAYNVLSLNILLVSLSDNGIFITS